MAARVMPAILGLVAAVALCWVLLGSAAPVGACATAVPVPFDRSTPIDADAWTAVGRLTEP